MWHPVYWNRLNSIRLSFAPCSSLYGWLCAHWSCLLDTIQLFLMLMRRQEISKPLWFHRKAWRCRGTDKHLLENPWQQLGDLATENNVLVEDFLLWNNLAAAQLRGTLEGAGKTPSVGWRRVLPVLRNHTGFEHTFHRIMNTRIQNYRRVNLSHYLRLVLRVKKGGLLPRLPDMSI